MLKAIGAMLMWTYFDLVGNQQKAGIWFIKFKRREALCLDLEPREYFQDPRSEKMSYTLWRRVKYPQD